MSSVAKYAKPFYFQPFLMMQLYKSFRVVEHHEIEHQETSHQMLWNQLESKFTMNANHVLIIFKLILLHNSCDHFLNRSTKWLTVAGPMLIFSLGKSFFSETHWWISIHFYISSSWFNKVKSSKRIFVRKLFLGHAIFLVAFGDSGRAKGP